MMKKRKRHTTENGLIKGTPKSVDEVVNISSDDYDDSGNDSPQNLEEILLILLNDGETKKRIKRDICTRRILSDHETQSLKLVVDQLEKAPYKFSSQGGACSLTDSDVASILLPWTIKHLLFLAAGKDNDPSELEMLWNLCAGAFELVIIDSPGCDPCSTTAYDVSTLNIVPPNLIQKLIVFALRSCTRSTHAATTLCLILSPIGFSQTVDFLCQTVFIVLAEVLADLVKEECDQTVVLKKETLHSIEKVAIASLQSLHGKQQSLHSSSSPKKIFQVLASEQVLAAIAKLSTLLALSDEVQILIQKIIWKAFFDPSTHVDSFRSMQLELPELQKIVINIPTGDKKQEKERIKEKKQAFHSYQEILMTSFYSLFHRLSTTEDPEPLTIAAFASLTELLGRGFCVQTTTWQSEMQQKNKKAAAPLVTANLQFRFLGSLIGPLLHILEKAYAGRLFRSFTCCLDLILEFDSYHPTYEDPNQHHFKFLQKISQHLLNLLGAGFDSTGENLKAIERLVRLNHLLIHGDLSRLIANAAMSLKREAMHVEFRFLLMTLFKTYQELRQLDYLLNALVESFKIFKMSSHQDQINTGLDSLNESFKDYDVIRVISIAVSCAPYGQTQALFKTFNNWIMKEVPMMQQHAGDDDEQALIGFLSVVVTLFVSLLRNLRVDKYSSKEVNSLCHHSLLSSVSLLMAQTQKDHLKHLSSLQSSNGSNEAQKHSTQFVKDTLLLFGWILDLQNRCSFWSSSEDLLTELSGDNNIESLVEETLDENSCLVLVAPQELQFVALYRIQQLHSLIYETQKEEFSLEVSRKEEFQKQAQHLVDFVFLLVVKNSTCIESFDNIQSGQNDLQQNQQSLILLSQFLPAWTAYCREEHVRAFLGLMFQNIASFCDDHYAVATALLEDASFFENDALHPNFLIVGLEYIRKLMKVPAGAKNVAEGPSRRNLRGESSNKSMIFKRVHKILDVLNNEPDESRICDNPIKLLDFLLEMDQHLCLLAIDDEAEVLIDATHVILLCRSLFSKIAVESVASLDIVQPRKWYKNLLTSLSKATKKVMCCGDENIADRLLVCSSELMEATAFICFYDNASAKVIGGIFKELMNCSEFVLDRVESTLYSAFATGISAALTNQNENMCCEFGIDVLNQLWDLKQRSLVKDISSFLLLVGSFWSFCGGDRDKTLFDRLVLDYLSVEKFFSEVRSDVLTYLMGIFLKHHTFDHVPNLLRKYALSKTENGSVESCILCKLVLQFDNIEYTEFLNKLLSKPSFNPESANMVRLLLGATKASQKHRFETSKFGFRILCTAVDSLRISQFESVKVANSVSELLLEIMKHKDVVTFKERDIARLLSQIACSLDSIGKLSSNEYKSEFFSLSCALVTSLVQRFPKQLCVCVATMTITLQKFFQFILMRVGPEEETSPIKAGRDLARLCEMLVAHRDVFKKHINGIILEFVDALGDNLEPTRKKAVAPSVYFLLEMVSEHEVNHLNSLLDPTGRAVFQSFYDAFKKRHIYKGT